MCNKPTAMGKTCTHLTPAYLTAEQHRNDIKINCAHWPLVGPKVLM